MKKQRICLRRTVFAARAMAFVFLAGVMVGATGCSRESAEKSVVTVQFPEQQHVHEKSGLNQGILTASHSEVWGHTSPTSLNEVRCYGLAISGVDKKNSKKCFKDNGDSVFETQDIVVAIAAGEEISMEVESGKQRDIKIFGFSAASVADCTRFSKDVPFSKLSRPFILSETTVDLTPGTVTVSMPLVFDSSKSFDFCSKSFDPPADIIPPRALLTMNSGEVFTFPSTNIGAYEDRVITIKNEGSVAATAVSALALEPPFEYFGGSYPGIGGTCSLQIAANSTCEIVVRYAPALVDTYEQELLLNYNNGSSIVEMVGTLKGLTSRGVLSVTGSFVFPPTIYSHISLAQEITLSNNGGASIVLQSVDSTGLSPAYTLTNSCMSVIHPNQSCQMSMTFLPPSAVSYISALGITYSDGVHAGQLHSQPISGTGVTPGQLYSAAPNLSFSGVLVNDSDTTVLNFQNIGGAPITGIALTIVDTTAFTQVSHTCPTPLGVNEICSIPIKFAPSSAIPFNTTYSIHYYSGGAPSNYGPFNLTGTGL